MKEQPTPGPWVVQGRDYCNRLCVSSEPRSHIVALVELPSGGPSELRANARLIAASPDHALLLRVIVSGRAHWQPFAFSSLGRGEVVVGVQRYIVSLDDFGCPLLTDELREALVSAEGGAG